MTITYKKKAPETFECFHLTTAKFNSYVKELKNKNLAAGPLGTWVSLFKSPLPYPVDEKMLTFTDSRNTAYTARVGEWLVRNTDGAYNVYCASSFNSQFEP